MISAKDRFYEALAHAVPDWGTQNNDPGFLQWLKEIDPMSQVQRETLLKYAFERWNHTQVIALFNGYKQSQGQSITPEATPTKEGLESQVVPETTGSGDGETTPKQKYSTKEEFLAAQTHFTRGRITEADFDKIANSYQAGIAAGVYK